MPTPTTSTASRKPSSTPSWAQARRLLAITRARRDFGWFCRGTLAPLGQAPARHHDLLIAELQAVAEGRVKRLMINMPPGSAKSTYASVLFPAWLIAQRARLDIIAASNIADTAEYFSRRAMSVVRDNPALLGYRLERESVGDWTTTNGARFRAVGMGAAIAGTRADIALIDDPVKSRQDADSETTREGQWRWFTGDLRTRLKPDAPIVVIMTRWHEDDLGGRLLATQRDLWRVVSIPAIAGDDDPLGRAPGEWLWDEDVYGYGAELRRVHAEYQTAGAMRDWAALYQQSPRPADGALFQTARIETVDAVEAGGRRVRAWDLAATKAAGTRDPDWTVGILMARVNDRYVIEDVVRLRGGPDEVEAAIVATASRDGHGVPIHLPQDPGQAGKAQVLYLTRRLAGHRVESAPVTGDKATRAAPLASQANVGNVSMLRAGWNRALLDELGGFPSAVHDDQVDAASLAFAALATKAPPIVIDPVALRRI